MPESFDCRVKPEELHHATVAPTGQMTNLLLQWNWIETPETEI
jgi:hypothetical protein